MSTTDERRRGAFDLREDDRSVQRDDVARLHDHELVVQREDLRPVGVLGARRVRVDGCDRGLDLVRPGLVASQARAHQVLPFGDELAIPE